MKRRGDTRKRSETFSLTFELLAFAPTYSTVLFIIISNTRITIEHSEQFASILSNPCSHCVSDWLLIMRRRHDDLVVRWWPIICACSCRSGTNKYNYKKTQYVKSMTTKHMGLIGAHWQRTKPKPERRRRRDWRNRLSSRTTYSPRSVTCVVRLRVTVIVRSG